MQWAIQQVEAGEDEIAGAHGRYLDQVSEEGKSRFALFRARGQDFEVPLYVVLPENPRECRKAWFVMHGRYGNAEVVRNAFASYLEDPNCLIIAPKMLTSQHSRQNFYTLGNMADNIRKGGKTEIKSKEEWSFGVIADTFRFFREIYPSLQEYNVYGHSAGAQFAYRNFLFAKLDEYLRQTFAANAGWWTLPDRSLPFPYGVKDLLNEEEIRLLLSRDLTVIAGQDDVLPKNVRRSRGAREQGKTRYERAQFMFNFSENLAREMRCDFGWSFVATPNLSHDSYGAGKVAVEIAK